MRLQPGRARGGGDDDTLKAGAAGGLCWRWQWHLHGLVAGRFSAKWPCSFACWSAAGAPVIGPPLGQWAAGCAKKAPRLGRSAPPAVLLPPVQLAWQSTPKIAKRAGLGLEYRMPVQWLSFQSTIAFP